jgi:hypothetical protein
MEPIVPTVGKLLERIRRLGWIVAKPDNSALLTQARIRVAIVKLVSELPWERICPARGAPY